MAAKKKARPEPDPIPEHFGSIDEAGEFWDSHSLGDYEDQTKPVEEFDCKIERVHYLMALEPTLAGQLREAAQQRGISSEALVHLWLSERLHETGTPTRGVSTDASHR